MNHLHLDYLPFAHFIRDDRETVSIMKSALTIVPQVCDILEEVELQLEANTDSVLPTSHNREEANIPIQTTQSQITQVTANNSQPTSSSSLKRKNPRFPLPANKKLCVIPLPPTDLSISNEAIEAEVTQPIANTTRNVVPVPPFPVEATGLKKQLEDDYDTFVRQISELAALERQKNILLEKFIRISGLVSGNQNNSDEGNNAPLSNESQLV